jgi:hypothetical protein
MLIGTGKLAAFSAVSIFALPSYSEKFSILPVHAVQFTDSTVAWAK